MKKILEYLGITLLFGISLIYTENITSVVKNSDSIMKNIKSVSDEYRVESVNAIVSDKDIVPGINGCEIDINKSYEDMKKINAYTDKMLKYKDIIPEISITNIFDKYISSGNSKDRNVSIVVYIKDNVDKINEIVNIKLNVFLDSSILENGKVNVMKNIRIYNGGNNLKYDNVIVEWMNDIILDNYNKPKYCLNKDRSDDNLVVCARNKMHTISPKLVVTNTNMYEIKKQVQNGSILYFEENSISKIKEMSDYLIKKGYDIVYLDELLSENKCKK